MLHFSILYFSLASFLEGGTLYTFMRRNVNIQDFVCDDIVMSFIFEIIQNCDLLSSGDLCSNR